MTAFTSNIDWDDLSEIDTEKLEQDFISATSSNNSEEIAKIATEMNIPSFTIIGSVVRHYEICGKTVLSISE